MTVKSAKNLMLIIIWHENGPHRMMWNIILSKRTHLIPPKSIYKKQMSNNSCKFIPRKVTVIIYGECTQVSPFDNRLLWSLHYGLKLWYNSIEDVVHGYSLRWELESISIHKAKLDIWFINVSMTRLSKVVSRAYSSLNADRRGRRVHS